MKRVIFGLAFVVASCLSGMTTAAQPSATPASVGAANQREPSAHTIELVKRYFVAVHYDDTVNRMMSALMPPFLKLAFDRFPDVTPEKKAAITQAIDSAIADWLPKFRERMAVEVARVLTEEELEAAVTFYESPIGRSIVAKQPAIASVAKNLTEDMKPELLRIMADRLCHAIDCTKLEQPPIAKSS